MPLAEAVFDSFEWLIVVINAPQQNGPVANHASLVRRQVANSERQLVALQYIARLEMRRSW